ncbi:MAG: triple tyrosine motif-containing protein [Bacillota bacterium]|nr:triple tyrosine motif-containing protein [Bacillota bacterium]
MNEFPIEFDNESPQEKNKKITIKINYKLEDDLLYKFIIGSEGKWSTLKDFSEDMDAIWVPDREGIYTIMVQARKKEEQKPFNYVSKCNYVIGQSDKLLITDVKLDKYKLTVGEKNTVVVTANEENLLYRYKVREDKTWHIIMDYVTKNAITWTPKFPGKQELVVQCKRFDSQDNFDDSQKVIFDVLPATKVEIVDFKCLSSELYQDNEITFQVEASYEDTRMVLYRFMRIDREGNTQIIQDYSTKRIVSYFEKESGEFKLLCLAKDMYSPSAYDDRAVISYKIKKYKEVNIHSFTTDVSSPQLCETTVTLKAIAEGGRDLRYRFIIDGNYGEDSGYIKESNYIWNTKAPGKYKINLMIKDVSFEGKSEAESSLEFAIDEVSRSPVKINDVILDRNTNLLVGEVVNIKTIAEGGIDLRYAFVVTKNGKVNESISYGTCNFVNFTPEEEGEYELEIRVKDKYSIKEYDAHSLIHINASKFLAANIDYVLISKKDYFLIGDQIKIDVITQNTGQTLIKYGLYINGNKVEQGIYSEDKSYIITPKVSGIYNVEIFAKNKNSDKDFDHKKLIKVIVHDSLKIANTRIECDKTKPVVNEAITLTAHSEGGKEVVYEFYMMEKGEWNLVQEYSRKNYYVFMPFNRGKYKILVFCKSQFKKCSYEDYSLIEFDVS